MPLAAGSKLGPYEILAPLGAGGMGEVYRARDARLGREVAVKVLPRTAVTGDALRRFDQEARAAGMLAHPNILAVHDVGVDDGTPFVVTELLEGESLRDRMGGAALPPRKALDYAQQALRGLAAAHDKGIVHRDLKPENLFVTRDGRVKILDFGLAKLATPDGPDSGGAAGGEGQLPTAPLKTEPGVVMGTVGYMAPEQVRGRAADARADIFSFGVVLYEMLSGRRAFRGETAFDTLSAILNADPPDLASVNPEIPPALARIVRHCLEKGPDERFQSARDLAFHLESVETASSASTLATLSAPAPRWRGRAPVAVAAVAAVLLLVAYAAGRSRGGEAPVARAPHGAEPPSYQRLTFRRGRIANARFGPGGAEVVYDARWDGDPAEIYSARRGSPEARPLGVPGRVLAVSTRGEMALVRPPLLVHWWRDVGTLSRAPLGGGAPRDVLEDVDFADWSPDGDQLAVVHVVQGAERLEFPIGTVLHTSTGWIGWPRVSPRGDAVAFLDHPSFSDDGGVVMVASVGGKGARLLSGGWRTLQGLAWSPGGDEVLFTGTRSGIARAIHAVDLAGKERLVVRVPGTLTLQDVSARGELLVSQNDMRAFVVGRAPGEERERDLGWLDWSTVEDLSADGRKVLLVETGEAGGASYATYLRGMDGSPAVLLGQGAGTSLSPDGSWVLATDQAPAPVLKVMPTGAGQERSVDLGRVTSCDHATWLPDGKRFVLAGSEPGARSRVYLADVGGTPRAIGPEGVGRPFLVSPEGDRVLAKGPDDGWTVLPIPEGKPVPVPSIPSGLWPSVWSADGSVLMFGLRQVPTNVYRIDVATGQAELWKAIAPDDRAGVEVIGPIKFTPDGRGYVYGYERTLSTLYLVEGVMDRNEAAR